MIDKIQNSIILGALFHDLEKVLEKKYFENNSAFFDALKNICDVEELKNILLRKEDSKSFQIVSLASEFQSGKNISDELKNQINSKKKQLVNLFPFISIEEDINKKEVFASLKKAEEDINKDKKISRWIPLNKLVYSNLKDGNLFFGKGDDFEKYKTKFKKELGDMLDEIVKKKNDLSFEPVLSYFILLLQKYLWCLPANTEDDFPDVSLWEHLSLTAAIADCLCLYLKDSKEPFDLKKINLEKIEEARTKEAFCLIVGDFSGIQSYIFNIQKMKTAAKRLKGRSFLVQMISEDIKNYILEFLRLNSLNTIISAGGKFIILVPNVDNIEANFINIKGEVEEKMFERFKGEIKYNLALSDAFSGWEFSEPKESAKNSDEEKKTKEERGGDFGKYFDDAFIEAAKSKYRSFESVLMENEKWKAKEDEKTGEKDKFIIKDEKERDEKSLCKLCKKYLMDEKNYKETAKMVKEDSICENCGEEIELGDMLRKDNKYIIWKKINKKPDGNKSNSKEEAKLLFSNIKLANNADELKEGGLITIINPDNESMDEIVKSIADKNGKVEAKFFANYVATKKEKGNEEIKDFGEILDDEMEIKGKGLRKLAVLKGDVDNLGKIFYFGLKNYKDFKNNSYTATRLKTLSLYLNLFFESYLDYLGRKYIDESGKKKFENIYIIFSGGDDFTVVGHWETMLEFALDLNEKFKNFACLNKEVHFSASLHLMDEKWPIFEEIEKANEELKEAKEKDRDKEENDKNKIWIFGKAIFWDEFIEIKKLADDFQKYIESEEVKFGYLWKLHKISKMIYDLLDESEEKPLKEKAHLTMWKPYLYYYTERNLKNKPDAKKWAMNNLYDKKLEDSIIRNLDIFATYLLYKNRK